VKPRSSSPLEGWPLVGLLTLALLAMSAGVLGVQGTGVGGAGALVRATGKSSALLLVLAFSASGLRRLWRSPVTVWMLRNRRQLGVSMAVSHTLHLAALIVWMTAWPAPFWKRNSSLVVIGVGSTAYLLMFAMVATSFDATARWLGARWWRRLHLAGSYLMAIIFAYNYLALSVRAPLAGGHLPLALLLLATFGLRLHAATTGSRSRAEKERPPP
jgi:DMSO/TMAO reductase YedYZ heme-binding membrane subunit